MKLKKLTNYANLPILVDSERIICIDANSLRKVYPNGKYDASVPPTLVETCSIYLDGEGASGENSSGFIVMGTYVEVLQQLGLSLS